VGREAAGRKLVRRVVMVERGGGLPQERGVVLAVKEEHGKAKFGFIRCEASEAPARCLTYLPTDQRTNLPTYQRTHLLTSHLVKRAHLQTCELANLQLTGWLTFNLPTCELATLQVRGQRGSALLPRLRAGARPHPTAWMRGANPEQPLP
jgi:hypothetical protein